MTVNEEKDHLSKPLGMDIIKEPTKFVVFGIVTAALGFVLGMVPGYLFGPYGIPISAALGVFIGWAYIQVAISLNWIR